MTGGSGLDCIVQDQLSSLDATDCYASTWLDILEKYEESGGRNGSGVDITWGGRGKGGRGLARRTYQPKDVVVENVRLEYVGGGSSSNNNNNTPKFQRRKNNNDNANLACKLLLDRSTLKLLSGHVYALIGQNGCGKSTLLRRIHAGKIPGFPPHISTMYIPQEVIIEPQLNDNNVNDEIAESLSVLDVLIRVHEQNMKKSSITIQKQIQQLEEQLENLDMSGIGGDGDNEEEEQQQQQMEELCDQISQLEEQMGDDNDANIIQHHAKQALEKVGIINDNISYGRLSTGQRKKVVLASVMLLIKCNGNCDLLLLDEPTNHLDISGLLQLRHLISRCSEDYKMTILLVSHDFDLINDVATDVIHFNHHFNCLEYYPGNYVDYRINKQRNMKHEIKTAIAVKKKRDNMIDTLNNLKKQPTPKRGGAKKKAKMISSYKKKIDKVGIEKDEKGHRWKQQKANTGIKNGSINALDASTRKKLTAAQLLKQVEEGSIKTPPDKAIQFVFRNTKSTWGEPLIMALDVGHGYGDTTTSSEKQSTTTTATDIESATDPTNNNNSNTLSMKIVKKPGFLFDCVDLCINEGGVYCILGNNNCGKSTLLRLLAQVQSPPLEGKVHHAQNITIGYYDQNAADKIIMTMSSTEGGEEMPNTTTTNKNTSTTTALSYLQNKYPKKTEQEIRGELTNFGLNPTQSTMNIQYLSGGERCRLCLADVMLTNPDVLVLDNPTSNLDVESVDALIYGIEQWNGTIVMVSHDANFIRSITNIQCCVLVEQEGKIRKIDGGIDTYLKSVYAVKK